MGEKYTLVEKLLNGYMTYLRNSKDKKTGSFF
jgi:hypothetical protein